MYNALRGWRALFDIHPKNEWQFNVQQFLKNIDLTGIYGRTMENLSNDERNRQTREDYGLKWEDTKYPWLSPLYGSNLGGTLGSAAGAVMPGGKVSNNLNKLYDTSDEKKRRFRGRKVYYRHKKIGW